jgi:glycosyltransferase involved in cell wall biosynthesis
MKVSVALCTYNGENYLNEQIDSILNQTRKVDEIVVCDDRSTDSTFEILEGYAKSHPDVFKVVKNGTTLRSVKNFEKAISICTGDVIFLSDQDDSWVPEKVADIIRFFEANPTINVVATNGYCMDENSDISAKYAFWDVPYLLENEGIQFQYAKLISCVSNIATGASMAIRKEIVKDCLPFPEIKNFHHDEWMAIIACKSESFRMLPEKYFNYRIHSSQQVGGVFHAYTPKTKKMLVEVFDISNFSISFSNAKKKLKRYTIAHQRNVLLAKYVSPYQDYFKTIVAENETLYDELKKAMLQHYPIKARVLFLTDKWFNKRQLIRST